MVPYSGNLPINFESAGAAQFGLTVATATQLTVPAGTKVAMIQVEPNTSPVRYRDDGTNPTASVGMYLSPGATFAFSGDFAKLSFTAVSGSPTLNVLYYK